MVRLLLLAGCGCLVVMAMTHLAEALHLLPGMPTAAMRLLRLSPVLLRDWARRSFAAPAPPVVDPIEEGPLPEESGSAD